MPNLARTRKTVVVTGASAGVGRATVERFAREGWQIGMIARDEERLASLADFVASCGGTALACPADVADADAIEAAADRIEAAFGPIDVWVNVAMATIFAPVADLTPAEFKRATEVSYLGFVYGTMSALKRMKPRDHGTIVQVGSGLAYRSVPLQSPYCGAKHAIIGFTDSLRSELIHDRSRVKVGVVHLPGVNTPQFSWGRNKLGKQPKPVPPIYQPEVPAEAIYTMALRPRREIWLTWSTWKVMLGQMFAAEFLDHYLAKTAYEGQMTGEDAPQRPGNLDQTVKGDYGSHGRFDGEALSYSSELKFVKHPVATGIGVCAAAFVASAGLRVLVRGLRR
ncbi:SDR family oxidoreductase [Pararhizobium mangrovi]|uniref:SDR family oxidoreductase n=1 Tax=Pararhizobium mangrovi TaxID=2590452 RepID=A0A506U5G1_9HYPH|nr:SDR family oxidoreductase [Pararhizobium mangrovi]TPW29612.1 SDR family oxidoreductase [Pararhizobium mangrovi]